MATVQEKPTLFQKLRTGLNGLLGRKQISAEDARKSDLARRKELHAAEGKVLDEMSSIPQEGDTLTNRGLKERIKNHGVEERNFLLEERAQVRRELLAEELGTKEAMHSLDNAERAAQVEHIGNLAASEAEAAVIRAEGAQESAAIEARSRVNVAGQEAEIARHEKVRQGHVDDKVQKTRVTEATTERLVAEQRDKQNIHHETAGAYIDSEKAMYEADTDLHKRTKDAAARAKESEAEAQILKNQSNVAMQQRIDASDARAAERANDAQAAAHERMMHSDATLHETANRALGDAATAEARERISKANTNTTEHRIREEAVTTRVEQHEAAKGARLAAEETAQAQHNIATAQARAAAEQSRVYEGSRLHSAKTDFKVDKLRAKGRALLAEAKNAGHGRLALAVGGMIALATAAIAMLRTPAEPKAPTFEDLQAQMLTPADLARPGAAPMLAAQQDRQWASSIEPQTGRVLN